MRKEFHRPYNMHQNIGQPWNNGHREDMSTMLVDMMTGRVDQWPDQVIAGSEVQAVRRTAVACAILAVATCFYGGQGIASPRVSESSAVFRAPDVMPHKRR